MWPVLGMVVLMATPAPLWAVLVVAPLACAVGMAGDAWCGVLADRRFEQATDQAIQVAGR